VIFGSDATVVGNRIEGTGVAAVHFSARAKPLAGSSNLLLGNATSSFQSFAGLAIQEDDGTRSGPDGGTPHDRLQQGTRAADLPGARVRLVQHVAGPADR
jgi:hypothetical protein